MRSSTLLRTLSTKLSSHFSPSSASAVAPWPPARSDFARWLSSQLEPLRLHPNLFATATWLARSLDLAISAQNMTTDKIQRLSETETKKFDRLPDHDDIVDLLDACNVIRRRIEEVKAYMSSLDIALHWLEGERGHSSIALQRARKALETCEAIEKRCPELDSCLSSLRKLGERIAVKGNEGGLTELREIVVGSRALAVLVISMASVALSFRTRRGIPMVVGKSGGGNNELSALQREAREEYEKRRKEGVVMEELKEVVVGSQRLRSLVNGGGGIEDVRVVVSEMKSKCRVLDERVNGMEERVEGLYKGLVGVRMGLLGVISQA